MKLRLAGALQPVAPRRSTVAAAEARLRARHRTILGEGARARPKGVLTAAEQTGTKKVAPARMLLPFGLKRAKTA